MSDVKSYLITDCGHTNTTVALFDVVGQSYTLIAKATVTTTAAPPWNDILLGVRKAIQRIEGITGREFLNEAGRLIKPASPSGARGVDFFAATLSVADPISLITVGLFENVSLASAKQVAHSTYATEIDSFSLADKRSEQEQVDTLVDAQPDVILVVGGTDGGADKRLFEMIEAVGVGAFVLQERTPPLQIIYAGNSDIREEVNQQLGQYTALHIVDNVRPNLETESIESATQKVDEFYQQFKLSQVSGVKDLNGWCTAPIMTTADAFGGILHYFAAMQDGRVFGLDVGSDSVTFVSATPDFVRKVVRNDIGMGRPLPNLLEEMSVSDILHWLPTEQSEGATLDFIYNKALYPETLPLTESELLLEQAIVRQMIRSVVEETATHWAQFDTTWQNRIGHIPAMKMLIVRGHLFASTPRKGQVLFMLLDALQPTGIFKVAMDQYGILPALGLLAKQNPDVVVQTLERGVLTDLGWVIVPIGKGQLGQKVLTIIVEQDGVKQLESEVEYGTLEVISLEPESTVDITIKPHNRFDIGLGRGQSSKLTLKVGSTGIVVDARGRPLQLPSDALARQSLIRQWLWDMGG